jgi:hypothetical protein
VPKAYRGVAILKSVRPPGPFCRASAVPPAFVLSLAAYFTLMVIDLRLPSERHSSWQTVAVMLATVSVASVALELMRRIPLFSRSASFYDQLLNLRKPFPSHTRLSTSTKAVLFLMSSRRWGKREQLV